MAVIPYRAAHMKQIRPHADQAAIAEFITPVHAKALEGKYAISYVVDGRVVAVGGVYELWPGRAVTWSYLDRECGPHMLGIHRAAARLFAESGFRRIEADVSVGFQAGHRWLRLLGFKQEAACMEGFQPTGEDSSLYARITPWQSHLH